MVYRRLYTLAMEYLPEIAEFMLGSSYDYENCIMYWITLDYKIFADKSEAINHQMEYLLEEGDEY